MQIRTYGYIPSALPDSNCYGPGAPERSSYLSSDLSSFKLPKFELPQLPPDLTAGLKQLPSDLSSGLKQLPSQLRAFELPKVDLSGVQVPKLPAVELPKVDLSSVQVPKLPAIELPKMELPAMELPKAPAAAQPSGAAADKVGALGGQLSATPPRL